MAVPVHKRVPTASPPFTIGQLRKSVPAHCFERSVLTSSKYLGADLAMAASLYFLSTWIPSAPTGVTPPLVRYFLPDTLALFGVLNVVTRMALAGWHGCVQCSWFVCVALQYALWPAYWWLQGVVCTGLWVVAHECGHQVGVTVLLGHCVRAAKHLCPHLCMVPAVVLGG